MSKMIASAKVGEALNPQVVALAKLGLTDAEIKQVLDDDKRIDKGEKLCSEVDRLKKQIETCCDLPYETQARIKVLLGEAMELVKGEE